MRKLKDKEIKQRLVYILCRFDEICRENHLRYSLGYGTLLGAARHKGFIPWDDDIDVVMPQEDYLKFLQLDCFKQQSPGDDVFLYEIDNANVRDIKYLFPFAKLMDGKTKIEAQAFREVGGLWIDIFPLTGLPASEKDVTELYKIIMKDHDVLAAAHRYRDLKKCSPIDFVKQLRCTYYYKHSAPIVQRMKKNAFRYDFNQSEKVANVAWGPGAREIMPREIFDQYIELEFEGHMFPVVKEYDDYLTHIYGNWRQLPPKEQQVAHHYFDAYIDEVR